MVYWASILISCILGMATPIPAGSKIEGGCGGWRGATARGAVFIYSFIQGGGGAKASERERERERVRETKYSFIGLSG
jgi:hypothetical protein